MNSKSAPIQALVLSAALFAGGTPLATAEERDPLVSTIDTVMAGYATRGAWTSPLASTETPEEKDALVATIETVMTGYVSRGEWTSPLASAENLEEKDALVATIDTVMTGYVSRGEWTSPLGSTNGDGGATQPSADTILTALVQQYDRASLDRGGWVNAFVNDVGYDSGNALLAVSPGEGITSHAQAA
jgi:hypothetical protein